MTGVAFREQEDHAHLLKRIGFHIRDGGPEALDDSLVRGTPGPMQWLLN